MSAAAGHEVQLRWRDFDGLGHVNHPVVLTYLEEGRDAFLDECDIGRVEYVVGRCSVTFLKEIKLDSDSVSVECGVREIGNTSFTTSERILDRKGDVVAEAEFGLVMWDPVKPGPRPITEQERVALMPDAADRTDPAPGRQGGGDE
jgi:acyl-CoA thioester hydrolase